MNEAARLKAEFALDPTEPPIACLLSAHDILSTDWPEPMWAIPKYLSAGLCILAGKAKIGKSWLALQIACAVASGGIAFGEHVAKGSVLYLALEDPPRRLKDRMIRQHWPDNLPVDFMVLGKFQTEIGDLKNGGGVKLSEQIRQVGYRLVIIDTFSRAFTGDQNEADQMTAALTPLQEISHKHNCAIMLNDHHKKGLAPETDAIGDILGSTAKGAMADCVWGLYRERGKADAKLSITGRDVEEHTLDLTMDWLTGSWQYKGDSDMLQIAQRHSDIMAFLETEESATFSQIVAEVEQNKGTVWHDVQDLIANGSIRRIGEGRGDRVKYELARQSGF